MGVRFPPLAPKQHGVTMSAQFVQFIFPCKDCLVRAACKEKPDNEGVKSVLFNDNGNPRCLAVPKLPLDITYHKGVLECWAVLGAELMSALQKSEDPKTLKETHNNIPMQYVSLMGKMSYLLCYMVNSTSWNLGELQEFDRFEIKQRIKNLHL